MSSPTPPAPTTPAGSPLNAVAWDIFKFFASLKLALILLAVLIVGLAGGTIIESRHSAAFAKAQVYDAPWFSIWLAFLIINLTCAALIRYPWKPHLTGFVITHAGIIVMLVGAKLGQVTGVEGGMDLYTGKAGRTQLEKFDDQWLEVGLPGTGRIVKLPYSVAVDRPTPDNPKVYELPDDGLMVRVLDVAAVETAVVSLPVPASEATVEDLPKIHFRLHSQQMPMINSVNADLTLGQEDNIPPLLAYSFRAGMPPQTAAASSTVGSGEATEGASGKVPSRERFYLYTNFPSSPTAETIGPPSGLQGSLEYTDGGSAETSKAVLHLTLKSKTFDLEIGDKVGQTLPLPGSEYSVRVFKLVRNLNINTKAPPDERAQERSATGPANFPAVVIDLLGPLVDATATALAQPVSPHGGNMNSPHGSMGGMDGMGEGNFLATLTLYLGADQQVRYVYHSKQHGDSTGVLTIGQPASTGVRDIQVELVAFSPSARRMLYFRPRPGMEFDPDKPDRVRPGLLCEVSYNGARQQVWVGRQRRKDIRPQALLMNGKTVNLQLGAQTVDLGFEVSLKNFEVPVNEGTQNPADFKSTLAIGPKAMPGQPESKEVSQIYMNHPTNYPNNGWGAYLGTSYKFSQANHDPDDRTFSGVQVLLDPGWMPKWVGALMICFGIFTMFYLKPYFEGRRQMLAEMQAADPETQAATAQKAAEILQRARAQKSGAGTKA